MEQSSKAQIVATLGPSSTKLEILKSMMEHQMDAARLNLSWGTLEEKEEEIKLVYDLSEKLGRRIPVIVDLPGPRIQEEKGHTLDDEAPAAITEEDKKFIKFAVEHNVDYVAISFVSGAADIEMGRNVIAEYGGKQKIIAKIERREALEHLEEIVEKADSVMVARGDLGNQIPIEQVPFVQDRIVKEAKKQGKPVIVATEMLLSMVERPVPTRAEVTDVANAILGGADAVMLSEETTIGKHPVEAVSVMERIVLEAEKHLAGKKVFNQL